MRIKPIIDFYNNFMYKKRESGILGELIMFKLARNILGFIQGYGCCPNCGDSWSWKPTSEVTCGDSTTNAVLICIKCLEHPAELDVDHITANLARYGWEQDGVDQARLVLTSLKKEKVA